MTSSVFSNQYPSTRYQGSKRKVAQWIVDKTKHLNYKSVLDGFCGTCSVAYEFKKLGKEVTCNDILKSNYITAIALIANSREMLNEKEVEDILCKHDERNYSDFVERTFKGIYYTDKENRWIDTIIQNIQCIENPFKKAIALFALFQSCLIKRPFNLFHRKNLQLRLNHVERAFHNHVTWERRFDECFKEFVKEANACVFSNGFKNNALNMDIFNLEETAFDLVYVDPPYISPDGKTVDYYHFYHFLEGLCDYDMWGKRIDYGSKNLRLKSKVNSWMRQETTVKAFERLFENFQDSIIIVSYRSPGSPSKSVLKTLLEQFKENVGVYSIRRKYALSKRNNHEILLIGE
jgi:adenine-specific DNA-methyltransferase